MVELSWCFRAFRRERTTKFILIAIWLGERDLVRLFGVLCRLSPRGKGELNWQLDCELLQETAKAIQRQGKYSYNSAPQYRLTSGLD